jgi:hypothetical protein
MHTTDDQKQFTTLRARLAMQGHSLHRTSPDNDAVAYYVERWGLVRHLPTLDDVARFLVQTGGA